MASLKMLLQVLMLKYTVYESMSQYLLQILNLHNCKE